MFIEHKFFFSFVIGNFCCWTNCFGPINFVLDFRCIKFFMAFKRRKKLKSNKFIYKLLIWWVLIYKSTYFKFFFFFGLYWVKFVGWTLFIYLFLVLLLVKFNRFALDHWVFLAHLDLNIRHQICTFWGVFFFFFFFFVE